MHKLSLFLLVIAAALSSVSLAQVRTPERMEVDPGGFLSIPIESPLADVQLRVILPPGFRLMSVPTLAGGRALANVLLGPNIRAGRYEVIVQALGGQTVLASSRVEVWVRPRPDLRIAAPRGKTVVQGSKVVYVIRVENRGNAVDNVSFDLSSSLDFTFTPKRLRLAPAEVGEVTVTLVATSKQNDALTIRLRSSLDPDYKRHALIYTKILPFAGADGLRGPVLSYNLGLGIGYDPNGLSWKLGAGFGGSLSDYIRLGSGTSFSPDLGAQINFWGPDWRLGYRYAGGTSRLEGELGPLELYVSAPDWQGPFTIGGSLSGEIGFLHASYRSGLGSLRAGLDWAVVPGIRILPWAGLTGNFRVGSASASGTAGIRVKMEQAAFTLDGRTAYVLGQLSGGLVATSRQQDPLGFRVEGYFGQKKFTVSASLRGRVGPESFVEPTVSYDGKLYARLGLLYESIELPIAWRANVGVRGGRAVVGTSLDGRFGGFSARASLGFLAGDPSWGVSLGYREPGYSIAAGLGGTPWPSLIHLNGEYFFEDWLLEGRYRYDLQTDTTEGRARLSYAYGSELSAFSEVTYDGELTWRLGAKLALRGGFATPEPVIAFFGGRATGRVYGEVYRDENRNGVRDTGEEAVSTGRVALADASGVVGGSGKYEVEAYPGRYLVRVLALPTDLSLLRAIEVRVDQGARTRLDIPVETVAGVVGQAWYDTNRNGVFDDDEAAVVYARVDIRGADGVKVAWTDGRGIFQAGGLVPGSYSLMLRREDLRRFQEPSPPVRLVLAPGPLPRVALSAVPVIRELRKTLAAEDLVLRARLLTPQLPPGADLRISADAKGADVVWVVMGTKRFDMVSADDGVWEVNIPLPADAKGAIYLNVVARRGEKERKQNLLAVVRPGPLARLELQPAFVSPGEVVGVRALFLTAVKGAFLVVDRERFPMRRIDDYTFALELKAPDRSGTIEVSLETEGRVWAKGRFKVEGE